MAVPITDCLEINMEVPITECLEINTESLEISLRYRKNVLPEPAGYRAPIKEAIPQRCESVQIKPDSDPDDENITGSDGIPVSGSDIYGVNFIKSNDIKADPDGKNITGSDYVKPDSDSKHSTLSLVCMLRIQKSEKKLNRHNHASALEPPEMGFFTYLDDARTHQDSKERRRNPLLFQEFELNSAEKRVPRENENQSAHKLNNGFSGGVNVAKLVLMLLIIMGSASADSVNPSPSCQLPVKNVHLRQDRRIYNYSETSANELHLRHSVCQKISEAFLSNSTLATELDQIGFLMEFQIPEVIDREISRTLHKLKCKMTAKGKVSVSTVGGFEHLNNMEEMHEHLLKHVENHNDKFRFCENFGANLISSRTARKNKAKLKSNPIISVNVCWYAALSQLIHIFSKRLIRQSVKPVDGVESCSSDEEIKNLTFVYDCLCVCLFIALTVGCVLCSNVYWRRIMLGFCKENIQTECLESQCGTGELGEKGIVLNEQQECFDFINIKDHDRKYIHETDADLKRKHERNYTTKIKTLVLQDQNKRDVGLDESFYEEITKKEDGDIFEGNCKVVDLCLTRRSPLSNETDKPYDVDSEDNYHDDTAMNGQMDKDRPNFRISANGAGTHGPADAIYWNGDRCKSQCIDINNVDNTDSPTLKPNRAVCFPYIIQEQTDIKATNASHGDVMLNELQPDSQNEKNKIWDEILDVDCIGEMLKGEEPPCHRAEAFFELCLDEKLPFVALPLPGDTKSGLNEDVNSSLKDITLKVIPNPPNNFEGNSKVRSLQDRSPLDCFERKFVKDDHRSREKQYNLTLLESDIERLRYVSWLPLHKLPVPKVEINVHYVDQFPPLVAIITQIAEGNTPRPQISMRYELLRLCTLRTYPRENKPYLIKLAAAGFYYASDGDGVVCYCCGIRRYGWTEKDDPMAVHKRINQHCKFFKKNAEYNVPATSFGPLSEKEAFLDAIPDCEVPNYSEDVNNDNDNNRQSSQPTTQNRTGLGIQTSMPKHPQYAPKTTRENSYNGWPNTSSHTPKELAEAGFYFAGFGDCVRCFHCGIGLRHWDKEDNVWIEHARWSKDCVFLLQKKGREFVELVQLAVQYTNELEDETGASGTSSGVVDLEKYLVGEAAQFVLTKGFTPIQIKESLEAILSKDSNPKITGPSLLQKVIELHGKKNEPAPEDNTNSTPESTVSTPETVEKQVRGETSEAAMADPKAIKEENEQLKEQTVCKVCLDNTVSIVFLPCGHLVTCADCAPAMRKCPICRAVVKGTVRTYMS